MLGSGDFVGGVATRRGGGLAVAAIAQTSGLLLLAPLLAVAGDPPSVTALGYGAAAGLAGSIGVAALYRALAVGWMSVVAPLTAVGSVAVPLVGSLLLQQSLPSTVQLLGVACAALAGGIAYGFGPLGARSGIVPSLAAAVLLGVWFVFIEQGAASSGSWAITSARAMGALTMLLCASATGAWARLGLGWQLAILAGLFDTAGTILIVVAVGEMHIVAVAALAGLYPLSTMALARVLLGERLPWSSRIGAGVAVIGIALISVGA